MPPRSPLAPDRFPELPPIDGVRLAAVSAGIRYKGRTDLMVAALEAGTTIAGVFTRSTMPGAPVDWCRDCLRTSRGSVRGVVVNSGNSNTFTGKAGRDAVKQTAERAAKLLNCRPDEVYVSSTGVIGEPLSVDKILDALPVVVEKLSTASWAEAAEAIMTTDTFPKGATAVTKIDGVPVRINGFVKGSGMIAPNMGTMLGYVFTDAKLPQAVLQDILSAATDISFNSITVDSDTSTSDTVLLCATGRAAHKPVTAANDPRLADFRTAFDAVMLDLAKQIARDGEGATKFVTINVAGAQSDFAARRIGLAIGNSPLVKTAIAASDANWGRIVGAIGKAGEKADRDSLTIAIGGVRICDQGGPLPDYDEAPVTAHMKGREIVIDVDVGVGSGKATVWTCDLTHGYIDINGSYRS